MNLTGCPSMSSTAGPFYARWVDDPTLGFEALEARLQAEEQPWLEERARHLLY